ncbi:MAG: ABC transporter ATP-binding protein [Saprospiraceae bacterium]|nr:ABC transporter ATP-binding protein [Saprospiraceae bacterium]
MVEGIDIYKNYGDLAVLKGVKIKISPSEIVTIMGKSGAGKSTLLHILGTLDEADLGQIIIDDTDISRLKNKALAEFRNKTIGFVFQFHHLLPEFTARENIMIPSLIMKTSKLKAGKRAEELMDYLGIKERRDHKPNELSGGEQQRVAVARALVNNPRIILADEPTGNLDSQTSEEMHQLFLNLRKDLGQTFVIVTHNPELAEMSDRMLYMEDGVITKKKGHEAEGI